MGDYKGHTSDAFERSLYKTTDFDVTCSMNTNLPFHATNIHVHLKQIDTLNVFTFAIIKKGDSYQLLFYGTRKTTDYETCAKAFDVLNNLLSNPPELLKELFFIQDLRLSILDVNTDSKTKKLLELLFDQIFLKNDIQKKILEKNLSNQPQLILLLKKQIPVLEQKLSTIESELNKEKLTPESLKQSIKTKLAKNIGNLKTAEFVLEQNAVNEMFSDNHSINIEFPKKTKSENATIWVTTLDGAINFFSVDRTKRGGKGRKNKKSKKGGTRKNKKSKNLSRKKRKHYNI